jgi:flagellar operon protein
VSVALNPALVPPGAGVRPAGAPSATPARRGAETQPAQSFAAVLDQATRPAPADGAQSLHFSKHALERVQRRGIELDAGTLGRLQDGVARAAGKGSRDSVVLVDGTAFVVAVGNRTVITAVGSQQMRDHVFTNIDSAVIA